MKTILTAFYILFAIFIAKVSYAQANDQSLRIVIKSDTSVPLITVTFKQAGNSDDVVIQSLQSVSNISLEAKNQLMVIVDDNHNSDDNNHLISVLKSLAKLDSVTLKDYIDKLEIVGKVFSKMEKSASLQSDKEFLIDLQDFKMLVRKNIPCIELLKSIIEWVDKTLKTIPSAPTINRNVG